MGINSILAISAGRASILSGGPDFGPREGQEQVLAQQRSSEDAAIVSLAQSSAGEKSTSTPLVYERGQFTNRRDAELTDAEKRKVEELKKRDAEVRFHEQAHANQLGRHKRSGPNYEYETGPDKKQYAVGGEVKADTSPEATPEETIEKAQVIKRAALAPAEPSAADRAAAGSAERLEAEARAEKVKEEKEEQQETSEKSLSSPPEETPKDARLGAYLKAAEIGVQETANTLREIFA